MKALFYSIYAALFNFSSVFAKPNEQLTAFVSMHNENFADSLGALYDELKKDESRRFIFISRSSLNSPLGAVNFFASAVKLAKAGHIFLNDNFMPLGKLKIKPGVDVVQLWHGEGAFKRFGLAIDQPPEVRKAEVAANNRLTAVVCSSESVRSIYAEAFGVDERKVLPLGSPRADYFLEKSNLKVARAALEMQFPLLNGKGLVLYAPTFRGNPKADSEILNHFPFDEFAREFPGSILAVKLHPQVHGAKMPSGVLDLTDYPDTRRLCAAADILITDYSSVCMAFALTGRKIVFYAYDLDSYIDDRNFYFDYASYVPGPIARNGKQLIEALKARTDENELSRFISFNFDSPDGKSAKRIAERFYYGNTA